jgi:small redox-active disulfide protein 2
MKEFVVLGSGCAKCEKTAELIRLFADQNDIPVSIRKETDPEAIMNYGVMSTPAVAVDGQVVHSGSIPNRAKITEWLK